MIKKRRSIFVMIKMILLSALMDRGLMKEGILLRRFKIKKERLNLNSMINMDMKLLRMGRLGNK